MITPEGVPEDAPMRYGYGLVLDELEGNEQVSHGGGIHGFNSYLAHYPREDLTVVALVNLNGPAATQTAQAAALIALGVDLSAPPADLPLSAEDRDRYVGVYDLDVIRVRIFEDGEHLMAQGDGQSAFRLLYQGEHEFRASFDPAVRLTFTVEPDAPVRLTLHQGGASYAGEREPN
jgi:D-alanyl-D-alanine carboxypeptidase